jgi:hypothetical protein
MSDIFLEYGNALIGLVGVIIGGFVVSFREWWSSRIERHREGSYSAIRLICILNEYADKCVDAVQDDGTFLGQPAGRTESGEEYFAAQVTPPKPLEFPEDISWRSLPEGLMHRTLALANKARSTDRYIDGQREYAAIPPYYDEFFEARQEGYAKLGLDAIDIAADLRERFGIEAVDQPDLGSGWDPKEFLCDKIADFDEQRSKVKARLEAKSVEPSRKLGRDNE